MQWSKLINILQLFKFRYIWTFKHIIIKKLSFLLYFFILFIFFINVSSLLNPIIHGLLCMVMNNYTGTTPFATSCIKPLILYRIKRLFQIIYQLFKIRHSPDWQHRTYLSGGGASKKKRVAEQLLHIRF